MPPIKSNLNAWKEALEDFGLIGLVCGPLPEPPKSGPVILKEPFSMPPPKQPPTKPPDTKATIAPAWKVPADPMKNPPQEALEACGGLEELKARICKCEACPLGAGRTKFVFGEGSPCARMMFVGEGPGKEEDIQGRPFVGRAGELLDKMITALGMAREDAYIANVVKCRPPDNRIPAPAESQACMRYLYRQIELIRPAVIVGLGATPLRDLAGIASGITKLRGQWRSVSIGGSEYPFMPTFHPAYVLRQYTKEVRQAVWSDLQAAREITGF